MKKIIYCLVSIMTLAAGCGDKVAEGTFVLEGTIEKADSCTALYLITTNPNDALKVDTIAVADGRFTFADTLSAPVDERLLAAEYPLKRGNDNLCQLFLEEGRMQLVIADADSLSNAVLTGSVTQDEMNEAKAIVKPFLAPIRELDDEFYKVRAEGDTVRLAQIQKEREELARQYKEAEDAWVAEHPLSYYAFMTKSYGLSRMSLESVDSLLNSFPEKLKGTKTYHTVELELNNLRKSAPGAPATDFTDTDINGEEFSLSSLKGHYIILDFWASWCGPCRNSMPHVKALYEKYKDKGLEVVCVADNDSRPDDWKKAVDEDGTGCFHHVLRGLKRAANGDYDRSEDKSDDYAVHYLPTKVLIGPDFKIVGKFEDEDLDVRLQEIFGF